MKNRVSFPLINSPTVVSGRKSRCIYHFCRHTCAPFSSLRFRRLGSIDGPVRQAFLHSECFGDDCLYSLGPSRIAARHIRFTGAPLLRRCSLGCWTSVVVRSAYIKEQDTHNGKPPAAVELAAHSNPSHSFGSLPAPALLLHLCIPIPSHVPSQSDLLTCYTQIYLFPAKLPQSFLK
jgi:hypothetical protein